MLRDHRGRELEPATLTLRDGTPIAVVEGGDGPPLILVPGLSGDKEAFLYQFPAFTRHFRVLAVDLRRVRGDEPEGIDLFVDDLVDVMDAFGVPSAAVLGLSFGGTLAMRLGVREPGRVRALVLVNTLARLDLSHVGLNRSLLIPLAYVTTRYTPPRVAETFSRVWGDLQVWVYDPSDGNGRVFYYQQTSAARVPFPAGSRRLALLRPFDLRDDLPAIRAPALVVRGTTDTYCPARWAREIAALIPQADFLEIAGAGHLALISKAETFNRVVLRWLMEHLEDA